MGAIKMPPRPAPYEGVIRPELERLGRTELDPRHVEAYIRVQYGTLDHLDRRTFNREIAVAVGCIDMAGTEASEKLARSYAL